MRGIEVLLETNKGKLGNMTFKFKVKLNRSGQNDLSTAQWVSDVAIKFVCKTLGRVCWIGQV